MLKLLTFFLTLLSISHAQIQIYGQCGGALWQGPKQCAAGLTCQYQNEWYSQCLPGTGTKPTNAPTKPIVTSTSSPASTNGYFTAKNGKLYDANGKEFLIRGVNSAHLWFDGSNRNYALKSLASMNRANVNLVRIVWGLNPSGGLNKDSLENVIKTIISLKMIPMIELHDATGSSDVNRLVECATWFKNNMDLFKKYKKYILINIANEWSPWGTSLEAWRDAWNKAIAVVRSSGWGGAIVVDASAYAQNPDGPIKYGKDMVNADPSKNLIFSVHMYTQWRKNNGDYKIEPKLTELKNKGLTVIVGEFASSHPDGCSWVEIDVYEIMRQCKAKGIGYIGWSWHGNGKGGCNSSLAPLNIIKGSDSVEATWLSNDYTPWGNALINYTGYGIKDTSVRASYF